MNNKFPLIKLDRVMNTNIFYWNIDFSINDEDNNNYCLLFLDLDNALSEIEFNATMNLPTFIRKYKDILFYITENSSYEVTHRLMNYLSYLKCLLENRQHFYFNEYEYLIDDDFLKDHDFKPDLVKVPKQNSKDKFIFLTIDETIDYLMEHYDLENDLVSKEIFILGNKNTVNNEQFFLSPIFEHTKGNKLTKKDLNRLSFKRNHRNIIHCKNCFEQPDVLNEFIYENRCKLDITNYQIVIQIDGSKVSSSTDILKAILNELYLPYYNDSSNIVLFTILFRSLKTLKTKHIVVHSLCNKDILNDTLFLTLVNCFNYLLNINFLFTDLMYIKSAIQNDDKKSDTNNDFDDTEF